MAKVYTLFCITETPLGAGAIHPMKSFDHKNDADDACRKTVAAMAEIIEGTVLVKTPSGPRKVMTVKQLLTQMGIATLSHNVLEQETHGALILTPTSAIIQ